MQPPQLIHQPPPCLQDPALENPDPRRRPDSPIYKVDPDLDENIPDAQAEFSSDEDHTGEKYFEIYLI